jgi:hypothetical protein
MLVAAVRSPWVIRGWPPAAGALFSVPSFDERILFSSVSIRVHPESAKQSLAGSC